MRETARYDAGRSAPAVTPTALQDRPVELLQQLLRFDTTNPPGNERQCIQWIAGLLQELGLEVKIVAADPARPNLIARLTDLRFMELIHAADERLPADTIEFGTRALERVLERFS